MNQTLHIQVPNDGAGKFYNDFYFAVSDLMPGRCEMPDGNIISVTNTRPQPNYQFPPMTVYNYADSAMYQNYLKNKQ
jgi:hypothetical protein